MEPSYDHWNNTNLDKYLSGKPSKTHEMMMSDNTNHNLSASLDYDYPMMSNNVNSGGSYYPSATGGGNGGNNGYFNSSNGYNDFNMSRQHSSDMLDSQHNAVLNAASADYDYDYGNMHLSHDADDNHSQWPTATASYNDYGGNDKNLPSAFSSGNMMNSNNFQPMYQVLGGNNGGGGGGNGPLLHSQSSDDSYRYRNQNQQQQHHQQQQHQQQHRPKDNQYHDHSGQMNRNSMYSMQGGGGNMRHSGQMGLPSGRSGGGGNNYPGMKSVPNYGGGGGQGQGGMRHDISPGGGLGGLQHPPGTGGSNAQGRAINKMLLDVLRDRIVDPNRLAMIVDANIERMDCVNLATLLFHTGKKRLLLTPLFIRRIAARFSMLGEQLRAREASNALYGLKCMSSDCLEVRQLILALSHKVSMSGSDLVAQAVGNALYGCQMMTSEHEEVRYLLQILAIKVNRCTELLEAQNVGNALYGLRGMNSDYKEVRMIILALTPKIASAKEDLNGQALGNSLYGLQSMSAKETEVRSLISVLADKVNRCWENLKAQEVGNALYGLKRMNSDILEVRQLLEALVPKIEASPEILDAQAIGNSFYGMQNMKSDNSSVLKLLRVMAMKVSLSNAELDGQAMGNSLYGLQGMKSDHEDVRAVVREITMKIESSSLEMNAQELGNALYGLQNMTSDHNEVRSLLYALAKKVASSKHDLTSQEIGNALYGLQGMKSNTWETRLLVRQLAIKVSKSTALLDPQGIANSLYGLQRMSSESEEVRMLIQALAVKIDQSWKLLNSQHIANSLYGLQNLSSFEVEVANLVRALVTKVSSCRDDMTAKQVSCALFGLQSMYSHHQDVLELINALTEKILSCKDAMTGLQLGGTLFGLQGFDDSTAVVKAMIGAIGNHLLPAVKEYDLNNLGNCFYGLQRLSTNSPELIELVNGLSAMLGSCLGGQGGGGGGGQEEANGLVCSNILYGLQNCNANIPSVADVLSLVLKQIQLIVNRCKSGNHSPGSPVATATAVLPSFTEIKTLYQTLTLVLMTIPNLGMRAGLLEGFEKQRAFLYECLESRTASEFVRSTTIPQIRLTHGLRVLMQHEPFDIRANELYLGFEICSLIALKPDIKFPLISPTATSLLWEPVLNIEILGSSHTFPAQDLFTRLRNRYFESKGIAVEMIHASMIASNSFGKGMAGKRMMIESLRTHDQLFQVLLPPTVEDATQCAMILHAHGYKQHGLMSSIHEYSVDQLVDHFPVTAAAAGGRNIGRSGGSLMIDTSSNVANYPTGAIFDGFSNSTDYEYMDDNLENDGRGFSQTTMDLTARIPAHGNVHHHKWIGESPKLSPNNTIHSPQRRNSSTTSSVFDFANVTMALNAAAAAGFSSGTPTASGGSSVTGATVGGFNLPVRHSHSMSGMSLSPGSMSPPLPGGEINFSTMGSMPGSTRNRFNSMSAMSSSGMSDYGGYDYGNQSLPMSLSASPENSYFFSTPPITLTNATGPMQRVTSVSSFSGGLPGLSSSSSDPLPSTAAAAAVQPSVSDIHEVDEKQLELEIEIKKMEAKLLQLKKTKMKSRSGSVDSNASLNSRAAMAMYTNSLHYPPPPGMLDHDSMHESSSTDTSHLH